MSYNDRPNIPKSFKCFDIPKLRKIILEIDYQIEWAEHDKRRILTQLHFHNVTENRLLTMSDVIAKIHKLEDLRDEVRSAYQEKFDEDINQG